MDKKQVLKDIKNSVIKTLPEGAVIKKAVFKGETHNGQITLPVVITYQRQKSNGMGTVVTTDEVDFIPPYDPFTGEPTA